MDISGEKLIIVETVSCSRGTTGVVGVDGIFSVMSELTESFLSKLGYTMLEQATALTECEKGAVVSEITICVHDYQQGLS